MSSKVKNRIMAAGLAMSAWLAGPLAGAQSVDTAILTVARRYFLTQADARCHLLDPATAMALKGGYVQARNAAIRSGRDMTQLTPYLDAARAAADRSPCDAPQLNAEAATARASFSSFAAMPRLSLPAGRASWSADRSHEQADAWRLVQYQSSAGANAAMGLYGSLGDNRLVVMARFADGAKPYAARLLVRDPDMTPLGIVNPSAYSMTTSAPLGFGSGALNFPARGMSDVQAALRPAVAANGFGFSLTGDYVGTQPVAEDAVRFDFSTRAYPAIARLDPREDMVVEFDFSDGPRFMRFGVGDFITGLSFIALPSPYGGGLAG